MICEYDEGEFPKEFVMSSDVRSGKIEVGGKVESLIVYFKDDASIKEGREFTFAGNRVVVYVGGDGFPVALQFLDPLPVSPIDLPSPRQILYGLACQMIDKA